MFLVVPYVGLILSSGQDNFCLIHVSLIPVLGVVGEQVIHNNPSVIFMDSYLLTSIFIFPSLLYDEYYCLSAQKTKPTQHSVRELRALGLTPHLLACRSAQVHFPTCLPPLFMPVSRVPMNANFYIELYFTKSCILTMYMKVNLLSFVSPILAELGDLEAYFEIYLLKSHAYMF